MKAIIRDSEGIIRADIKGCKTFAQARKNLKKTSITIQDDWTVELVMEVKELMADKDKAVPAWKDLIPYNSTDCTYTDRDRKRFFELRASGITPNNCWLIGAHVVEIVDLSIATGKRIYSKIHHDIIGDVQYSGRYVHVGVLSVKTIPGDTI